jgi:putative DNA primase/helicase
VIDAADEYRNEMDIIGNFTKDRCDQKPGVQIRARELFKCYEDNKEHACSEQFFGLRLKELGLKQKRLSEGHYWLDIMIKTL